MTNDVLKTGLWTHRSTEETQAIYDDWAAKYEADVIGSGYATPTRLATALAGHADLKKPILDFGCGTGLGGQALALAGFKDIWGTDINAAMLNLIPDPSPYARIWRSEPGRIDGVEMGSVPAMAAIGVISLGAAPPETLATCLDYLQPGGIFGLSFNDPTLAEGSYDVALSTLLDQGKATVLHRSHGPHLSEKNMGSDIIILQKNA